MIGNENVKVQRSKRLQVENHGGAGPEATQKVVWIQVQPPHLRTSHSKKKQECSSARIELLTDNETGAGSNPVIHLMNFELK